jgi:hypothetical protein
MMIKMYQKDERKNLNLFIKLLYLSKLNKDLIY